MEAGDRPESEGLFRSVFESALIGIALVNADGTTHSVNPALARMLGYGVSELEALSFAEVTHPEDVGDDLENFRKMIAGDIRGYQMEKRFLRRDGTVMHANLHCSMASGWEGMAIGMVEDVTDRKQGEAAQRELARSRALLELLNQRTMEVEQAMRAKDEFLISANHEIKTPLAGMLMISEALQAEVYGPMTARSQEALRRLRNTGGHLLGLINQTMREARKEQPDVLFNRRSVVLEPLVRDSVDMFREIAGRKSIAIEENYGAEAVRALADHGAVKQILVNLLSNALKYTPDEGRIGIEMNTAPDGSRAYVTIWDTGEGIPLEHQRTIFQKYHRLPSPDSDADGLGLGLYITLRLAEWQNGTLNLSSVPGQGSRFTLCLPSDSDAEVPPEDLADGSIRLPAPARILLVEDNETGAAFLARFLNRSGFWVDVAGTGREALACVEQTGYHAIVLDMQLPDMTGLDVMRILRDAGKPTAGILAISALSVSGTEDDVIALGGRGFLAKPFAPSKLREMLYELAGEGSWNDVR
ncbi:MAG TPA: PAS domain S-box protein [Kiritimatiellia bacterium]|nr:PAS domain S-box protein [Kiritimatiellia bacterium]